MPSSSSVRAIFEDKVQKDVANLLTADVTADKVRDVRVACEAYTGDLKRIASLKGLKRHVAISFLKQSVTVTIMDFSLEGAPATVCSCERAGDPAGAAPEAAVRGLAATSSAGAEDPDPGRAVARRSCLSQAGG